MITNTKFEIEKRATVGYIMGMTSNEILADVVSNVKATVSTDYLNGVSKMPYSVVDGNGWFSCIDKNNGYDAVTLKKQLDLLGEQYGLDGDAVYDRIEEVRNINKNPIYKSKMKKVIAEAKQISGKGKKI